MVTRFSNRFSDRPRFLCSASYADGHAACCRTGTLNGVHKVRWVDGATVFLVNTEICLPAVLALLRDRGDVVEYVPKQTLAEHPCLGFTSPWRVVNAACVAGPCRCCCLQPDGVREPIPRPVFGQLP